MGRVCVDLYPMQLRDAARAGRGLPQVRRRVRRQRRHRACPAGRAHRDRLGRRRRRPRPLRARLADGAGRGLPLAGHPPHAAHRARLLRGMAARQLPDHLLPHPHLPRLGADGLVARPGGPGRGAAGLRQRHRLRHRAVAAGHAGRCWRRGPAAPAPPCSTSTGGPVLWDDPVDYAACMRDAARHAGVALGSDEETGRGGGRGGRLPAARSGRGRRRQQARRPRCDGVRRRAASRRWCRPTRSRS